MLPPGDALPPGSARSNPVRLLVPYLAQYKLRIVVALSCLLLAKVAHVTVPIVLKWIVDDMSASGVARAIVVVPVLLLVAYGIARFSVTLFTELREFFFAKVTQRAVRRIALETFEHLHRLSLRFHLARQTGGLTRDIERGTRGITSLMSYVLFSILPTLVEFALVCGVLAWNYDWTFVTITLITLVGYIAASAGQRLNVDSMITRSGFAFVFYLFHQVLYAALGASLLGQQFALDPPETLLFAVMNAAVAAPLFQLLDRL